MAHTTSNAIACIKHVCVETIVRLSHHCARVVQIVYIYLCSNHKNTYGHIWGAQKLTAIASDVNNKHLLLKCYAHTLYKTQLVAPFSVP